MDRRQIFLDFLQDSTEQLEEIEKQLLELEEYLGKGTSQAPELVHALFRSFHSLKGSSGFFDLSLIVLISHEAETMLDMFRSSDVIILEEHIDALMESQEALAAFIKEMENNPDAELPEGVTAEATALKGKVSAINDAIRAGLNAGSFPSESLSSQDYQSENSPKRDSAAASEEKGRFTLFEQDSDSSKSLDVDSGETVELTVSPREGATENEKLATLASRPGRSIRIDVAKLDALMELVGEFSIGVSLVDDATQSARSDAELLRRRMNQLKKTSRHLQELSLSLRMVPIMQVFDKMKRLVRDLQKKTGKSFSLTLKGGDTELDKNVVEMLSEPLVHLLRNAVDHGLESPEKRGQMGKPAAGRLILEARYSGGEVWILLRDDGQGLDRQKILNRARESGLLQGNPDTLTDRQVWSFIFKPGFSTRGDVTEMSGRGVGMDVVERTLNRVNGRIDIYTRADRGTLFVLKIPLTLSLLEGMVIRIGEDYFIIPTTDIRESIVYEEQSERSILQGVNFINLRDEYVPVFHLHDILAYRKKRTITSERPLLVIMEHEREAIGLVVDEVIGNTTVVVKSVFDIVGAIPGVSGCTVLGSGRVGLILDVKSIVGKFQKNFQAENTGVASQSG